MTTTASATSPADDRCGTPSRGGDCATSARCSCSARRWSRCTSLDDTFLQPPAGTSAADHLAGGLVPIALLAAAAWALRAGAGRMARPCWRWSSACSASASASSRPATTPPPSGPSGDDFTGLLAIPAGLLLVGLGGCDAVAVAAPRPERCSGASSAARCSSWPEPWPRSSSRSRCCSPMSSPMSSVRYVPADELGVAHENVSFTTSDGLRAARLVHPVAQRRGRRRLPGPARHPGARADAGAARLRRTAVRPSR